MHALITQWPAIGFALLAALAAAVGMVVRQRAIQDQFGDDQTDVVVTSWVRQPLWWAGTAAAFAGYAFQALALAYGSLLLVQPIVVSSLLFVLPLGAKYSRQHVTRSDWWWAVLLILGLTVFVMVGRPDDTGYQSSAVAWTIMLVASVAAVVGSIAAAARTTGRARAMLLAVSVGVLLGLIAVLTKVCAQRVIADGFRTLLTMPAAYLLIAIAVVVTILQQSAFNAGALQASVPIMLVGEPLVAILIGMVVLGEQLHAYGFGVVLLVGAVAAMTAAAVALGRGSGAHADRIHSPRSRAAATT